LSKFYKMKLVQSPKLLSLLFFVLAVVPDFSLAQTPPQLIYIDQFAPSFSAEAVRSEGVVECFDYYHFGSVQVDLTSTLEQVVPGATMTFTGSLKNDNPYPIVDGSVYVKIFKVGEENFKKENGYPLITFFEAGRDLTIPASGTTPFSFDWDVPTLLSGGDYEADFFFVTDHRFNLLGLTFTDDVTGNKVPFRVTTESNNQVTFDKHSVTLNKNTYRFAAYPPQFELDAPVTIEAKVSNPSSDTKSVVLTWKTYNWDGLREEALLDTFIKTVDLAPYESKMVSYTVTKYRGAVTYVLATIQDGDATSVINPRFVRDGIEETRINFPSVLSFPLIAGEKNIVFTCAHSTSQPIVEGNKLDLVLSDVETGKLIHQYQYRGGVTGAMMGLADEFTPDASYGKVKLTTTLTKSDGTTDVVEQIYDCTEIGISCPERPVSVSESNTADNRQISTAFIVAFIVVFVIVIGFVTVLYRRKHTRIDATENGAIFDQLELK
jgi:hypothetical protein